MSIYSQTLCTFQSGCLHEDLRCDLHKDVSAAESKDDLTFNIGPGYENVQHYPLGHG